MIPELGHVGLILALQLALLQAIYGLSGMRGRAAHGAAARGAAIGQGIFVVIGFAALVYSFAVNDFSVLNVAEHSSRHLPLQYRITAAWGSHEGSILLWTTLLAAWTVAVSFAAGARDDALGSGVIGILGLVGSGMLAFILLTSNPFKRLDPPPPEGLDLNPLLQDPGMIAHPPLLYMGYVGLSVAFAFALSAMLSEGGDGAWARRARPWTLVAWAFLTLGIAVGSGWAYYELGWGGWWFWDPTENASLMPWLVATALVHALRVTGQRGLFPLWTVGLAIGAFALSLLGTFLVRSGVLSSVHAFAQDPQRGLFLLLLVVAFGGGALLVLAARARRFGSSGALVPLSRETLMLAGNILLVVTMGTVLLGTLYPLFLDALSLGKVSVGPPYFNAVFVPLMIPVLLLLGVAPTVKWGGSASGGVAHLKAIAMAALAAGPALAAAYGELRWQAALGGAFATWSVLATLSVFRARRLTLRAAAMAVAHCGVAVGIVGIGFVTAFEQEQTVVLKRGELTQFAGYDIEFKGVVELPGANYSAVQGHLSVRRDSLPVVELRPEKRVYHASKMPMTESAIFVRPSGDLYAVLGDALSLDTWTVRLFHKPFVAWIWAGGVLMALGGVLAALAARREGKAKP